jgi:hypothetical protein
MSSRTSWRVASEAEAISGSPESDRPPRWRAWNQQIFQECGPLPLRDVDDLIRIAADRLMAIQLESMQRLIPSIVADGQAVGMALDVVARLDDRGDPEVLASPEPGGPRSADRMKIPSSQNDADAGLDVRSRQLIPP